MSAGGYSVYQLFFYVPASHLDAVKQAVFSVGGGCIGNYEHCAWQTSGEGQFRPLKGAHPFVGHIDGLEKLVEYRVELIVPEEKIRAVVAAMKLAHPYEEPAYGVLKLEIF